MQPRNALKPQGYLGRAASAVRSAPGHTGVPGFVGRAARDLLEGVVVAPVESALDIGKFAADSLTGDGAIYPDGRPAIERRDWFGRGRSGAMPVWQAVAEAQVPVAGAGAVGVPRNALGTFGGRLSRAPDLDALGRAQKMAKDGVDRTDIWEKTGWFKGGDGHWRFEIDDSAAAIPEKVQDLMKKIDPGDSLEFAKLRALIAHDDFFDAYPDAAGMTAIARLSSKRGGRHHDGDGRVDQEYLIAHGPAIDDIRNIALHELQHAAQSREGFARGANPAEFVEGGGLQGYRRDGEDAFRAYQRMLGEVEARAVQARADLTPEQRRMRAPWLDYDVPESDLIVIDRGQ